MKSPQSFARRDFLKAGAAAGAFVAASSVLSKGLYGAAAPAAPNYGPKKLPWAVQLYTVGGPWRMDPAGTLAHLASLGFKGVEFAGYPPGVDAKGLRKMLDDAGLKAVGSHVGLATMQGDQLKATAEFANIVGLPQIGVSNTSPGAGGRGAPAAPILIPGLTADQVTAVGMTDPLTKATAALTEARNAVNAATYAPVKNTAAVNSAINALAAAELNLANARADTVGKIQASPNKLTTDQIQSLINGGRGARGGGGRGAGPQVSQNTKAEWEAVADAFSEIGTNLKPYGLRTYYHCHPQDFATINGETTWDIFFARAKPPEQVFMQIDLGHMGTAGVDQVAEMKKFPSRAKTVHVKPTNGGGGKLVGDAGDNNNWPSLFAACEDPKVGGTEWYILEYDGGSMPQVDATMARMKEWGKV